MNIRVDLYMTDGEGDHAVRLAVMGGWDRVDPRKPWTVTERKAAIRWWIGRMVLMETER